MALSLVERVKRAQLPDPDQRAAIRAAAGVSLRDMADELGVSTMAVSRWERGLGAPEIDHAIAYRALLDGLARAVGYPS